MSVSSRVVISLMSVASRKRGLKTDPIIPMADNVTPGEPCFELKEGNVTTNESGAKKQRVQILHVIRNDKVWGHTIYLGDSSGFTCPPFIIKGHVELGNGRYEILETVQSLQDIADDFRINGYPVPEYEKPDMARAYEIIATYAKDKREGRIKVSV